MLSFFVSFPQIVRWNPSRRGSKWATNSWSCWSTPRSGRTGTVPPRTRGTSYKLTRGRSSGGVPVETKSSTSSCGKVFLHQDRNEEGRGVITPPLSPQLRPRRFRTRSSVKFTPSYPNQLFNNHNHQFVRIWFVRFVVGLVMWKTHVTRNSLNKGRSNKTLHCVHLCLFHFLFYFFVSSN